MQHGQQAHVAALVVFGAAAGIAEALGWDIFPCVIYHNEIVYSMYLSIDIYIYMCIYIYLLRELDLHLRILTNWYFRLPP